jgi:hypothetical protein
VSGKPRLARKSLAEGSASLVLREMKIEGLRVDPVDIAARKGIVTCAGLSAEKESEYDDEEAELIENWTPRFRR